MFLSSCLSENSEGHLTIGGVDVPALAREYGTPLYIMDEDAIRSTCREYRKAMLRHYGKNFLVAFASKAFCTKYMYKILAEENMGADVVSGGELYTALKAGFPMNRVYFHGNNKTDDEIKLALSSGVGRFVADNTEELSRLNEIAAAEGCVADISFRIKPGVEAHTHEFIKTGQIDSKFGVALINDEAFDFAKTALGLKNIRLVGVHCHIGSQIFDIDPFVHAADLMIDFISRVKSELGYEIAELNLGGGFGIRYTEKDDPKQIDEIVKSFTSAVLKKVSENNIKPPFLVIEPGRSIVAPYGITVYTVGSVKHIKNIRTYVSIDGGMTDNPRYALYQSEYTAVLPERINEPATETVTIAGRCCESGDLIGKDMKIPPVKPNDLIAVLSTGAYNYSMASNYNRIPRPPVVTVSGGKSRLIVRRESYEDLIRNDI
ncbi:MAG: diaminopimelate decarboxylase [Clostridiales bacterium]|jgi:diaminopimelate decarboxylase|nr:diaminopimelate decarboxylase [Clostridiales bacterium]